MVGENCDRILTQNKRFFVVKNRNLSEVALPSGTLHAYDSSLTSMVINSGFYRFDGSTFILLRTLSARNSYRMIARGMRFVLYGSNLTN